MKYYHRALEPQLIKALNHFPAVLITGPRQAGKSTLLKHSLKGYRYVTFDDPALRALALEDPQLFLSTHEPPLILDEIQYAPHLLSYLKIRIDQKRKSYGQYILTGSQSFSLMQGISETLAGRIAIFSLYPFSWDEVENISAFQGEPYHEEKLAQRIINGFYPEFFSNPKIDSQMWFSSYISTYLERDVRNLKAISDLSRFQMFLGILATRASQLLNLSEISKECGISQPTAKDWLSILQATYIIYLLKPFFKNKSKRLVKSPKLYFVDTGLLCYLLGIDHPNRLLRASERGSIFENMIISDRLKTQAYASQKKELFFYRTLSGLEVDLLIEGGKELEAYEIKFSKTPNTKMGSHLSKFRVDHPNAKTDLLCLRETPLPIKKNISAIHWRDLS